jgi:hypothetical protein
MNPDDLNRAFPHPATVAPRLEDLVAELDKRLARLEDLLRPQDLVEIPDDLRVPELELQHRAFVARIREREEG